MGRPSTPRLSLPLPAPYSRSPSSYQTRRLTGTLGMLNPYAYDVPGPDLRHPRAKIYLASNSGGWKLLHPGEGGEGVGVGGATPGHPGLPPGPPNSLDQGRYTRLPLSSLELVAGLPTWTANQCCRNGRQNVAQTHRCGVGCIPACLLGKFLSGRLKTHLV